MKTRGVALSPNIMRDGRPMTPREIAVSNSEPRSRFTWDDVTRIRARWTGKLVIKRSEEHTSELQSLMRISYAVFCLKKQNNNRTIRKSIHTNNYQNTI